MFSFVLSVVALVLLYNMTDRVNKLEEEVRNLKAKESTVKPIDGFNKSVGV